MLSKILKIRIFDIEVTNHCNLKCKFCPRDNIVLKGFMSLETFSSFLRNTKLKSTDSLSFVGLGEPLLHPDLPRFVKMAKEMYPHVTVWITTNGTLLDVELLHKLINAGTDVIDISFNGINKEEYENTMRGAIFEDVIKNIETAVCETRGTRTKVQVNSVITEENKGNIDKIKNFFREKGVERFQIRMLHNRGGSITSNSKRLKNYNTCWIFKIITFICWNGDVVYCSNDTNRTRIIGNIKTDTFKEIEKKKAIIIRNNLWLENCHVCTDIWREKLPHYLDKKIVEECAYRFIRVVTEIKTPIKKLMKIRSNDQ